MQTLLLYFHLACTSITLKGCISPIMDLHSAKQLLLFLSLFSNLVRPTTHYQKCCSYSYPRLSGMLSLRCLQVLKVNLQVRLNFHPRTLFSMQFRCYRLHRYL